MTRPLHQTLTKVLERLRYWAKKSATANDEPSALDNPELQEFVPDWTRPDIRPIYVNPLGNAILLAEEQTRVLIEGTPPEDLLAVIKELEEIVRQPCHDDVVTAIDGAIALLSILALGGPDLVAQAAELELDSINLFAHLEEQANREALQLIEVQQMILLRAIPYNVRDGKISVAIRDPAQISRVQELIPEHTLVPVLASGLDIAQSINHVQKMLT